MTTGTLTGFDMFWQVYVLQYGAPILQMLLWLAQIVVFVYAVVLFKRLVDYKTGRTAAADAAASATGTAAGAAGVAADAKAEPPAPAEEKIDVSEFVE